MIYPVDPFSMRIFQLLLRLFTNKDILQFGNKTNLEKKKIYSSNYLLQILQTPSINNFESHKQGKFYLLTQSAPLIIIICRSLF